MRPRILFLCSGRRVSLVERFDKAQCDIYCTDMDKYAPTAKIPQTVEFISSSSFDDPEKFIADIEKICDSKKIDAIIPLYDKAIDIYCNIQHSLGTNVKWFGPDKETNDILFSKRKSIEFFNSLYLKAPPEVREYSGETIVGRDLTGCGSKGLHFINSQKELDASKVLYNSIYTKFIKGKEFTVDCYKDTNNFINAVPRERIKVRAGEVLVSKTIHDDKIQNEALKIMRKLNLLGPCTLQCIQDEVGDLWWIEGNPRFGGGVILTLEAMGEYNYINLIKNDIGAPKHTAAVTNLGTGPVRLGDDFNSTIKYQLRWKEMIMTRADQEIFFDV